ncbi:MAG TPA: hypothetical protein VF744_21710 [Beijerinckiaceae bacterium]|jgi:hypothetical protein
MNARTLITLDPETQRLLAEDVLKLERLRKAVRVGEEALERGEFEDIESDDLGPYLAGLGTTARGSRS